MLVNLRAEMVRYGISEADIANAIGRERRAVKNRLIGSVKISAKDIKIIRDSFFPNLSLDYLLSEAPCEAESKVS